MNIALVAAFRSEASKILGLLENPVKEKVCGVKVWRGSLNSHRVTVLICGIGPKRASGSLERAEEILEGVELAVVFGVCGALCGDCSPGETVVMEDVSAVWQADREPLKLYLPETDAALECRRGSLVTHSMPVFDGRVAARLAERFGAGYVDMETWEVANYFRQRDVPVAVIKAVSDRADKMAVVDFAIHARNAAASCAETLYRILLGL